MSLTARAPEFATSVSHESLSLDDLPVHRLTLNWLPSLTGGPSGTETVNRETPVLSASSPASHIPPHLHHAELRHRLDLRRDPRHDALRADVRRSAIPAKRATSLRLRHRPASNRQRRRLHHRTDRRRPTHETRRHSHLTGGRRGYVHLRHVVLGDAPHGGHLRPRHAPPAHSHGLRRRLAGRPVLDAHQQPNLQPAHG